MATRVVTARKVKAWGHIGTNVIQQVSADVTGTVAVNLNRGSPFTVLRMIGEYAIFPGAVNVVDDMCAVSLGIGVFSLDAVTLGGTAMPDPEDEPQYPWLFWASHLFKQSIAAQNTDGSPAMGLRRAFDVRTMRKVARGQALAMVFQYRDISGAPTYDIAFERTRVLFAE